MKRLIYCALIVIAQSSMADSFHCSAPKTQLTFKTKGNSISGSLLSYIGTRGQDYVSFSGNIESSTTIGTKDYVLIDSMGSSMKLSLNHLRKTTASLFTLGSKIDFNDCSQIYTDITFPTPPANCPRCGDADFQ